MDDLLLCARYGDVEDLKELLQSPEVEKINDADDSGNTALHMACGNGHFECVLLLIHFGARHLANKTGNYPLHWAVQNKHIKVVKALLKKFDDIDVLSRNEFGRGCVTEAFQTQDTELVSLLLEHKSATEELLAKGTGVEPEAETETNLNGPKIIQKVELSFAFDSNLPKLRVREVALDWDKQVFQEKASEDTTGITVWSASLILSRWIIDMRSEFKDKTVCELGAGCGLSGLAAYKYTKAHQVVLTDLFESTLENLRYNVELNIPTGCENCGAMQKFSSENPSGKLLQCSRCGNAQYCSAECQKESWKSHKLVCHDAKRTIQVEALDWAEETLVGQYDILLGSDLVYHNSIVPILARTIDRVLKPDGVFYHVASDQRSSLDEFKTAMTELGFICQVYLVPESYKGNPLVDESAQLFDIHFNEMEDTYFRYTFRRS